MDPRYRDVKRADIPEVALPGGVVARIICGAVGKTRGPVRDIVIDPEYLDVSMPPQAEFVHPTKTDHTVLAYVFEGQGCFSGQAEPSSYAVKPASYFDLERKPFLGDRSVILFGGGGRIGVATADSPVRFLLISGRPLGEPVAWRGPIVMNTEKELETAFREYRAGTFIQHAGPSRTK